MSHAKEMQELLTKRPGMTQDTMIGICYQAVVTNALNGMYSRKR